MTTEVKSIVLALKETPRILQELIDEINPALYTQEIVKGKWSIHEHAIHIAVGDIYGFQKRLEDFKSKEKPVFTPLSGENFSKNFFKDLDLQKTLADFFQIRRNT